MNEIEAKKKLVPENIKLKILDLKKLETTLGHLPPEQWTVNELQKKAEDTSYQRNIVQLESQTEIIFTEICEELLSFDFQPLEIVSIVNEVLFYTGGPKYCNEAEVLDALGLE